MILMVDTTTRQIGKAIVEELLRGGGNAAGFELIDTTGMNISHCVGCNCCWLKTPGVCAIQDDYEPILRKMRYDHQPDIGIIYTGDGDQAYLERWCQRTALNLGSRSLGVFSERDKKEVVVCMLS